MCKMILYQVIRNEGRWMINLSLYEHIIKLIIILILIEICPFINKLGVKDGKYKSVNKLNLVLLKSMSVSNIGTF